MSSLSDEVRKWVTSFNEPLDVILLSFDSALVEPLVDVLKDVVNCKHIVFSNKFLEPLRTNNVIGSSRLEQKAPGKVISTIDYGSTPRPSLFFCDFNNDTRFTPMHLDYFDTVDRQPKYRKYCRGVIMYRYTGNPPLNGYWKFAAAKKDSTSSIIFLELSDWGKICQNIPERRINNDTTERIDILSNLTVSKIWLEDLKNLLRYLIKVFLKTEDYTDKILSDENMIIWIKCFIHETFNYIYNYELLEFVGDKICSEKFTIYAAEKYPRLQKNEITEYHNQYMSKNHQWYLSDDLHLSDFVLADLSVFKITNKYKTDIFETFIGALHYTCKKISLPLAEIACQNVFTLIGEQFPFEKKMIYGINKHRISQVLESLGYRNGGEHFKVTFYENNKGSEDPISIWYIVASKDFVDFVEAQKKKGKDISALLNLQLQYKSNLEKKDATELRFWDSIARIFDTAGIDIRYAKTLKNSFLYTLSLFDQETYKITRNKLSIMYPKEDVDKIIKQIQFKLREGEGEGNYIIMYIHTFEAEPESPLLNTLVMYTDETQKAGDEYIEEMENIIQTVNLAVVPAPLAGKYVGTYELTSFALGCYNCVQKFIQ